MRLLKTLPAVIMLLLSSAVFAQTLDIANPKYQVIQEVLQRIARTQISSRIAPTLVVIEGQRLIAQFRIQPKPTVFVDEKLYDLCVSLGADSLNALAAILGHELAHYYENHGWANGFSDLLDSNASSTDEALTLPKKTEYEAAADHFGLFYALLAGYDAIRVLPKILEVIYKSYQLPDKLDGYPSRLERLALAQRQVEELAPLSQVFKAGQLLYHFKYYRSAATCYQYLIRYFPSKEILNNLAVCQLAEAAELLGKEDLYFAYPFEFDAVNRLQDALPPSRDLLHQEQVRRLLNEASTVLEKTLLMDPNYADAAINLACTQSLKGNQASAIGTINDLEAKNSEQKQSLPGNAYLIRGIARVKNEQIDRARQDFETAKQLDAYQADYNLALYLKIDQNWSSSLQDWFTEWPAVSQWIGDYLSYRLKEKPPMLSRPVQWITNTDINEDFGKPIRFNHAGQYITITSSLKNSSDLVKIKLSAEDQTIYAKTINQYHEDFSLVRKYLGSTINELLVSQGPPTSCQEEKEEKKYCTYPQMGVRVDKEIIQEMTAIKIIEF